MVQMWAGSYWLFTSWTMEVSQILVIGCWTPPGAILMYTMENGLRDHGVWGPQNEYFKAYVSH